MNLIPKGCDLSHYCEFLFLFSLCSGFLWGGGLLFGQGSQKESCGKVFFLLILFPLFFFLFLFWLVFFGSSQSKANPSHTPSFLPFFSTYEWGGGGGRGMHMYE